MITPGFSLTATERVLPKLALDFTTASLDPRVTFTRALNTATVTNSSGYITSINANLPRFDYDPITLACKGLLIEEARTNLILNSNLSASWPATRASLISSSTLSPDGVNNALKLQEDSSNNSHYCNQNVTVANATVYTYSIFAKKGERDYLAVYCISTTAAANTFFNLANGTIVSTSSGATATIQNVGNGWYKCSVTTTTAATTSGIYPGISADGVNASYQGNGASGIYLWGGQIELGAFTTSYIPTTTTALTRNADVATMTGTNFSDWYNGTAGTFVVKGLANSYNSGCFMSLSNAGLSYTNSLFVTVSFNNYLVQAYQSSVLQFQQSLNGQQGNVFQVAFGYASNNAAGAFNGGTVSTDNTYTQPTCDRMFIGGNSNATITGQMLISAIRFYPQRLINNEVVAFSKQG